MSIISVNQISVGVVDVQPPIFLIKTNDSLSTITTTGYLSPNSQNTYGVVFSNPSYCLVSNTTDNITPLILTIASDGAITLSEQVSPGNVTLPVVSGDFAVFNGTTGLIKDAGYLPSDATKTIVIMANETFEVGNVPAFSDENGTLTDTGILANTIMQTTTDNMMFAGSGIVYPKSNGTESSNAISLTGVAGVITTSSLTTAGGSSYSITWTNGKMTSTSGINLFVVGGTNTNNNISLKTVPGDGTAVITIINNTASTALNGTIELSYLIY